MSLSLTKIKLKREEYEKNYKIIQKYSRQLKKNLLDRTGHLKIKQTLAKKTHSPPPSQIKKRKKKTTTTTKPVRLKQ